MTHSTIPTNSTCERQNLFTLCVPNFEHAELSLSKGSCYSIIRNESTIHYYYVQYYTVAEQGFLNIWVYGAFLLHLCDYKVNYFYSVSKGWELALKPKKFCRNFCRIYLLEYIRKEIHRKIDHFAMNFFFLYFSINKWLFQLCFICHIKKMICQLFVYFQSHYDVTRSIH